MTERYPNKRIRHRIRGKFTKPDAVEVCGECNRPLVTVWVDNKFPMPTKQCGCATRNVYELREEGATEAKRLYLVVPDPWDDDNATRWRNEMMETAKAPDFTTGGDEDEWWRGFAERMERILTTDEWYRE